MILTILTAATMGVLGFYGFFRGVRRGLIAVAGTLLGAVLINLWQARWSVWLRTQMEQPAWPTFLLTAAIFLLVALLVGYGGSLLLPPRDPKAKGLGVRERALGPLVGALNGALIVSYLLRYANENWPNGEASDMIAASPLASLFDAWLPWFILAMVLTTTLFVLLRGTLRLSRILNRPIDSGATTATRYTPPPAKTPPPLTPTKDTPPPKTVAEADRRVLEKIEQANKK
ncbi:MAG: CvpA family protein [Chloroflexales bacterium]